MNNKPNTDDRFISVLVYDEPGVMAKLMNLFTRRGFLVNSISAGRSHDQGLTRLTVGIKGDEHCLEQVQKQLYKIIETVKVAAVDPARNVQREIALIKIRTFKSGKAELFRLIDFFQGRVLDVSPAGYLIVEVTGDSFKIDSFVSLLKNSTIMEIARSGVVAMDATDKTFRAKKASASKSNFTFQEV